MKFGTLHQILNPVTVTWLKFLKFKMVAAAILKIASLAINHRPIVRFQRNFAWGSRTAGRQGLRDEKCKFLKSNMADDRHFENRKIAISQWKIVRFWWNLVHYIKYWTRLQSRDQKLKFLKFKMAAAAILKIAFLAINYRPIVRFRRNFVCGSITAGRQRPHDKNCKFSKSKKADGRHSLNCHIPVKILFDFDKIWCTTACIEPDEVFKSVIAESYMW